MKKIISTKFCHSMSSPVIVMAFFLLCLPSTIAKRTKFPLSKTTIQTNDLETYIVHLELPGDRNFSGHEDTKTWYHSFLPESAESSSRIVHSYHNVFTGFSAKLSTQEAKALERVSGVVSARPQRLLPLHTTHSPSFLGLQVNGEAWLESKYGKNVIIGLLDGGITPTHPSFDDKGMPPPPTKWKGKCELNGTTCNKKLIGARSFLPGKSPVDDYGHGTHTSSIAAGTFVDQASIFGQVKGTAAGMAPQAHIAMYRVCDGNSGCSESAIMAAIDAAVEDGVDILSISIGGPSHPLSSDVIAIGAFGAMRKGILVSCSAGNEGPGPGSLFNEAPWILTVGASTLDRTIKATAVLGNGESYDGESLSQSSNLPPTLLPLFYSNETALCYSFENVDIKGKVVLCDCEKACNSYLKEQAVKIAGGSAMILANNKRQGESTFADLHLLPTTQLGYEAGERVKRYINSTKNPMTSIKFGGTVIEDSSSAPMVAGFSSRGPNVASPGILKPDIIGPGVNILAAWNKSIDGITRFYVVSGTSMSCPHLSGIAALIKSVHPDWSPAAIKSAIMTTADQLNHAKKPILDEQLEPANLFAIGAGHVNPSKALDPGLVYDIQPEDYIAYLCGLGYNDTQVYAVTNIKVECAKIATISEAELNYPSFVVELQPDRAVNQTYSRTLTNVGRTNSTYACSVISPNGVEITCAPQTLYFSEVNQKLTYKVTFSWSGLLFSDYVEGSLAWKSTSSSHIVNVPIAVKIK